MKQETLQLLHSIGFDNPNASIYEAAEWFRKEHKINVEANYLPNVEKFAALTSDMTIKPKNLTKEEFCKLSCDYTDKERFDEHYDALEHGLCKAVEKYKYWR